jgi:uncharacterized protein (TIGR02391 family)
MPDQVRKQDQKLIDEYIAWLDSRGRMPRTVKSYRQELEHLARSKGPILRIQSGDLRAYVHERGGGRATRARRHAPLKGFFDYLVGEAGALAQNPVAGIKRPSVTKPPHPEVTQVEGRLRDLPDESRVAARFVLETGLRKGELESINVRHTVSTQIMVQGRGGKRKVVPLSPHARELLEELGGRLPMDGRTLQKHLEKVGLTLELLRRIALRTAPTTLPLHPRLDERIRSLVDHRDSEEAVFNAYKEVEIRVRELSRSPADLVGVNLMRSAFGEKGVLTDRAAPPGEQLAIRDLFVGAVGSFKNPSSHRRVSRPAAEITELLALANFLMRELDRVEERLSRSP